MAWSTIMTTLIRGGLRGTKLVISDAHERLKPSIRQAFIQPDRPSASQMLRHVADQLRGKWPKHSSARAKPTCWRRWTFLSNTGEAPLNKPA